MPVAMFAADAQSGYKVTYDGGSLGDTKAGSGMKLVINPTTVVLIKDKAEIANIPAASITEISYGQDVHRRVGAARSWRSGAGRSRRYRVWRGYRCADAHLDRSDDFAGAEAA